MALTRCSSPRCRKLPFRLRENAGNDVERDQAFLRLGVAVNGEGNAEPAEEQLGLATPEI